MLTKEEQDLWKTTWKRERWTNRYITANNNGVMQSTKCWQTQACCGNYVFVVPV